RCGSGRSNLGPGSEVERGGPVECPLPTTLAQIEPLENGVNGVTGDGASEARRQSNAVPDLHTGVERDDRVVARRHVNSGGGYLAVRGIGNVKLTLNAPKPRGVHGAGGREGQLFGEITGIEDAVRVSMSIEPPGSRRSVERQRNAPRIHRDGITGENSERPEVAEPGGDLEMARR